MLPTSNIELDWIAAFQGDGSLKELMVWCSYLGAEALPVLLGFVYFVVSKKQGQRLYLLFTASAVFLHIFKFAFHLPRPFWVDPRIKSLTGSGGYGLPSGHVLGATIAWLFLAKSVGKKWIWVFCLMFVALVSISRVYLGVHFVSDVVAAWAIGLGLIWAFDVVERTTAKRLTRPSLLVKLGLAAGSTAVLLALGCGARWLAEGRDSSAWQTFGASARDLSGLFHSAGEFFGVGIGISLIARFPFELSRPLWKRSAGFAYALAGAWLIREAARSLPHAKGEPLHLILQFLSGGAMTFWMLFVAPLILRALDLTSGPHPRSARSGPKMIGLWNSRG